MKLSRFVFAALLFSFVLAGCSKEIRIAKKLTGTWDVTSLTSDGVELIGSYFSSVELFFGEYSKGDSKGDFTITIVDAILGQTAVDKGTYSLDENGEEVTFTSENGSTVTYMISLDGDKLEMEGTVDGVKEIFQAKRK